MPTPGKQTVSLDTLMQLGKTNLGEPCLKPADIHKGFAFYPIYFKRAERFSQGTRGRAK